MLMTTSMFHRKCRCLGLALAMISVIAFKASAVSASNDYLYLGDDGEQWCDVGEEYDSSPFYFETVSSATVSVKGLPSGITSSIYYEDGYGEVVCTGKAKKSGVYYVTCTAKNRNGYTMTATVKWLVGDADDGDYDDIGLSGWCDLDELDELCVGKYFNACGYNVASVKGLPTGLTWTKGSICTDDGVCTACSGFITGMPKKAGKYTITFTDSSRRRTVKTVIVYDSPSSWVTVTTGNGYSSRGKVTGGGIKHLGDTVKITAKSLNAKKYIFAGWYCDEECEEPFDSVNSGDYRTASDSFVYDYDFSEGIGAVYAKFIGPDEDYVEFCTDGEWHVDTESSSDEYWFDVESETAVKVTAKGLPKGVKLVGTRLVVADTSKLTPGTSVVTLTAKTATGLTATETIDIVVPNLSAPDVIFVDTEDGYEFAAGVLFDPSDIDIGVADGWTLSVKGLPSGLKWNSKKSCLESNGVLKESGVYTVTFTAKKGGKTRVATATFRVNALPTNAIGTFNGHNCDVGCTYFAVNVTVTTTADGKITVKLLDYINNQTVTMSKNGWDWFDGSCYCAEFSKISTAKSGVSTCSEGSSKIFDNIYLELDSDCSWDDVQIRGWWDREDGCEGIYTEFWAQRNAFGKSGNRYENSEAHAVAADLASRKTMKTAVVAEQGDYDEIWWSLAGPACIAGDGSFPISFVVKDTGVVTMSGRFLGKSISGSSFIHVYNDECDDCYGDDVYRGGLLGEGNPFANFVVKVDGKIYAVHIEFSADYKDCRHGTIRRIYAM